MAVSGLGRNFHICNFLDENEIASVVEDYFPQSFDKVGNSESSESENEINTADESDYENGLQQMESGEIQRREELLCAFSPLMPILMLLVLQPQTI